MSETIRTGELNRIYNRPSFGDEIYPQVKALNRDLFRVLYREYYDNCPQEYMVPLFAAEVERLGSPEAYAELMFEATHKEDESYRSSRTGSSAGRYSDDSHPHFRGTGQVLDP